MRTKLELWLVIQANFDKYFESGLCSLIDACWFENLISFKEAQALESDLREYRKGMNKKEYIKNGYYFWQCSKPEPRKNYINLQIERYKNAN